MTELGDWSSLSKLTKYTWRGGQYANYWYSSADGETKRTQWFGVDIVEMPDPPMAHVHQYFSVHPATRPGTASGRTTRATVASVSCLFADFDAKDEVKFSEYSPHLPDDYDRLTQDKQHSASKKAQEQAMMLDLPMYKARALARVDQCPLPPSEVIDTGGGYQCYWFLRDTVIVDDANRERIEALQAEWVQVIGADPGAKDLARVLRIPGSLNFKNYFAPDFPVVTVFERDHTRIYALSAFEELTGVDEVWMKAKSAKLPKREGADPVIGKFNDTVKVGDILERNNYKLGRSFQDIKRYSRPGREQNVTSIVVWNRENRSYHHSSSDALYVNGHSRDAFDVFTTLEHNGDTKSAYIAAKKQLDLWQEAVEVTVTGLKKKPQASEEPTEEPDSDEDAKLLEWPVHDHGNASVVKAMHPDAFGFCDALRWMANTGTHYETENAERSVNRAITETLIRRRMAAVEAQREDVVKGTVPNSARKNAVKDMYKGGCLTNARRGATQASLRCRPTSES